jgi:hypothetical protein
MLGIRQLCKDDIGGRPCASSQYLLDSGILAASAFIALTGCGLMPVSGPNTIDVNLGLTATGPQYGLVKLTPGTVKILAE